MAISLYSSVVRLMLVKHLKWVPLDHTSICPTWNLLVNSVVACSISRLVLFRIFMEYTFKYDSFGYWNKSLGCSQIVVFCQRNDSRMDLIRLSLSYRSWDEQEYCLLLGIFFKFYFKSLQFQRRRWYLCCFFNFNNWCEMLLSEF